MRAFKIIRLFLIPTLVLFLGGGMGQGFGCMSIGAKATQVTGQVLYASDNSSDPGVQVTGELYKCWLPSLGFPFGTPVAATEDTVSTNQDGYFSYTCSPSVSGSYYVVFVLTDGSFTTSNHTSTFKYENTAVDCGKIYFPNMTFRPKVTRAYDGGYGGLTAYALYGNGHTSIVKPLVVVEGFDPGNTMGFAEIYGLLQSESLLWDVLRLGFDVIIVNFDDGGTYIQRNAFALLDLLRYIKKEIQKNELNDIIVIGASMGGLISRYALAYAENKTISHYTRLFIAFDSPQQFANIPLGDQCFVKFFADHSDGAKEGLNMLDSIAAQQMLYHHYSDLYLGRNYANSLAGTPVNARRKALLDELKQYGYPKQTRNVAISNGRGDGKGYGFTPGTLIVDYAFKATGAWVYGRAGAIGTTYRWPVFEGEYDLVSSYDDMFVNVEPGWPPLDSCPGGGRRSSGDIADSSTDGHGDITSDYPWHCFIPTISALDIDTDDLFYNIDANITTIMDNHMTPFDAIYYPIGINDYNQEHLNYNQPHLEITEQNKGWIISEITAPTALCGDVYDGHGGPLTAVNSYNVTCDVIVPLGETLTIKPGAEIYFQSGYKIVANGTLNATGEPGNPIKLFSSDVPDCGMNLTSNMILKNGGELKPG